MIHKTAIINSNAKISSNVDIGPYVVIGPHVEIDNDVVIQSHVNIAGHTKIGKQNIFYPMSSIGSDPHRRFSYNRCQMRNPAVCKNWKNGDDRWDDRCFTGCNTICGINR